MRQAKREGDELALTHQNEIENVSPSSNQCIVETVQYHTRPLLSTARATSTVYDALHNAET